jgi:UDP-glucose 4-epimerase
MTSVVTVLGGGGFLGSAIVDELLAEGHRVRVLERPHNRPHRAFGPDEAVEWLPGDCRETADLRTALQDASAVVHLAWSTRPKSSNDQPIFDVESNVVASLQLLEEMRTQGIRKLLFASSGGTVYGPPIHTPIEEDHPHQPTTSYGITKLTVEKYLLLAKQLHGLRPVILRMANPYGERQRVEGAQGVVAAFLKCALAGEPIEIWGDGTVIRDFLHVADVSKACGAALRYEGEESVFNIGSGSGTSLNALVQLLSELLGRELEVIHRPGRSFDVKSNVLCCQRARRALNWEPSIGMAEGLRRTLDWLRAQPTA